MGAHPGFWVDSKPRCGAQISRPLYATHYVARVCVKRAQPDRSHLVGIQLRTLQRWSRRIAWTVEKGAWTVWKGWSKRTKPYGMRLAHEAVRRATCTRSRTLCDLRTQPYVMRLEQSRTACDLCSSRIVCGPAACRFSLRHACSITRLQVVCRPAHAYMRDTLYFQDTKYFEDTQCFEDAKYFDVYLRGTKYFAVRAAAAAEQASGRTSERTTPGCGSIINAASQKWWWRGQAQGLGRRPPTQRSARTPDESLKAR